MSERLVNLSEFNILSQQEASHDAQREVMQIPEVARLFRNTVLPLFGSALPDNMSIVLVGPGTNIFIESIAMQLALADAGINATNIFAIESNQDTITEAMDSIKSIREYLAANVHTNRLMGNVIRVDETDYVVKDELTNNTLKQKSIIVIGGNASDQDIVEFVQGCTPKDSSLLVIGRNVTPVEYTDSYIPIIRAWGNIIAAKHNERCPSILAFTCDDDSFADEITKELKIEMLYNHSLYMLTEENGRKITPPPNINTVDFQDLFISAVSNHKRE